MPDAPTMLPAQFRARGTDEAASASFPSCCRRKGTNCSRVLPAGRHEPPCGSPVRQGPHGGDGMPTLDQTSLGLDPSSYSRLCEMGVIVPLDRPLVRVHESSQPECWEDTYAGHRVFILVPDEESEAGRGWEPSSGSRHQEAAWLDLNPGPVTPDIFLFMSHHWKREESFCLPVTRGLALALAQLPAFCESKAV